MHVSMDGLGDHVASVFFVSSVAVLVLSLVSSIKVHNYEFKSQDKTDSRQYIAYNDESATYFPFTREQILLTPLVNDSKDSFSIYCDDIRLETGQELDMVIDVKSVYNEATEEFNPVDLYDRVPPVSTLENVGTGTLPLPKTYYGPQLIYNPEINKSPNIMFVNKRKE